MRFALLSLIVLLAACERNSTTPTAEERSRMDEASNMLNEAPANLDAIDDSAVANAPAADSRL